LNLWRPILLLRSVLCIICCAFGISVFAAEPLDRPAAAEIESPGVNPDDGGGSDRSPTAELTGVTVGWHGRYKLGKWTPVTIAIEVTGARGAATVELTAVDGDDLECVYQYPAVELTENGVVKWDGWVRWGRRRAGLRAVLKQDGRPIAERNWQGSQLPAGLAGADEVPAGLAPDEQLVVAVGSWPALAQTIQRRSQATASSISLVEVAPDQLPADPRSYDGVDLVIVPLGPLWESVVSGAPLTAASRTWADLANSPGHALLRWTQLGGRVLAFGAAGLDRAIAAEHPLQQLLPGRITRIAAQRQTAALEGFVGGGEPLNRLRRPGELTFSLPVAVVASPAGRAVVVEGSAADARPLILHQAVALGRVIYAGLDLDQFPFTEWTNTNRLIDRLLDLALGPAAQQQEAAAQRIAYAGYQDLSGQLRVTLDQFPGIAVTSFSWIALLIVIYIALIGPIDYWLLRRSGRRFVWTWFTFPCVVLLASAGTMALARQWKGTELQLNQVDIVDWDAATGLARGTHWFEIYSPTSRRWSGELRLDRPWSHGAAGVRWLTWLGLPGSSFGGLDNPPSRLRSDLAYLAPIDEPQPDQWRMAIQGLPLDTASSRGLSGRWWQHLDRPDVGQLRASLTGELSGTVRNPLQRPLQRLWLLHGRWVYELPMLGPDDTWTLDSSALPKNLEYLLTLRRVVDGKDRGTPWNAQSTDVERILQMIGFHAAAGGSSYTGLSNGYQSDLDLSDLVKLDRAILVGWSKIPSAQLHAAAEPLAASQLWAMYRVVIPVELAR
jgi:hypothetical protein